MSNKENNPIIKFTDLLTWQEGHKLVLLVYQAINEFPREERMALTDQMRRAAVSITSNIAEGFSRQGSKEKVQFYKHSAGSLTELQNQLIIARDLKYIQENQYEKILNQSIVVHKLLNGLVKATKEKRYQNDEN